MGLYALGTKQDDVRANIGLLFFVFSTGPVLSRLSRGGGCDHASIGGDPPASVASEMIAGLVRNFMHWGSNSQPQGSWSAGLLNHRHGH